ncbi:efflux RND transporter periplasmic adaptor subunit [Ramlibacter sp.]|uniref:efflux RND transporter periplasmic adaptor subunit n=1 Tax=Ramlibacter sp. TaxID=1917967 RepID=UPI002D2E1F33|nr:HlyD family efflux transporter periplasmic adaptor subunit [Ramlibacter sp.]HYD77944.1 HlyD family efflux transporter periplasmic adaptor subunit [Ramlibacter sp.]
MKWNRTTLYAGLSAALAIGALAWAFAPRPAPVEVATARQAPFEQWIEEDGQTRLRERYTISAPVAARVARSTLREGDAVAAGDVVAVLTPVMSSMVDERSAREAAARLRAASAGVERAAARVERGRIALEEARLNLQRDERLAADGYVSVSRLDSSRLAVGAAQRELDAARAEHELATHERAQAAAVLQPARPGTATGEPLAVRSPVAGVVLRLPLQSEATVTPGTALLDVGDPKQMEVVAELLTTDAVQARPGTRVAIERWGGPPLEGRVRRVEPAAFTKVSALGIEEQRVKVLIDPVDPPPEWQRLGDGFRVTVRVITTSAADALQVPVGALFPTGEGFAVFRLDEGRAKLQPVDVGGRNGSMAWVEAGLVAQQQVILYPPATVREGSRVAVRKP